MLCSHKYARCTQPSFLISQGFPFILFTPDCVTLSNLLSNMSKEDLEKSGTPDQVERADTKDSNSVLINEFTEAEQKRIVRRIDRRLVTTLGFLYCASLMDRTNLGSAAIAGSVISLCSRYTANDEQNGCGFETRWSKI